jgi:clan AA aspartic protease (TIGR02281 family)
MSTTTAAALILAVLVPALADAQTSSASQPVKVTGTARLFTAPDDASAQLNAPQLGDTLYPIAETIGSEDSRWYLVKTQSGVVGWIKAEGSSDAKRTEELFRGLLTRHASTFPVGISSPSSESKSAASILVPIVMTGSAAFVNVTLNRTVPALMLLDTGASYTVVSRRLATSLGLTEASRASISTANGPINVPLAHLDSIKVAAAETNNITVVIHDISSNPTLGLLGLDVLSRFHISIDSRRKLLILAPR